MTNAILLPYLAYPLFYDPVLNADKLFGYTVQAGNVIAIILGYFIWDIYVSIESQDPAFIIHGIFAFLLGWTGGWLQMVNGVFLLSVFFGVRICWGNWCSIELFNRAPIAPSLLLLVLNVSLNGLNLFWFWKMIDSVRRRFIPTTEKTIGEKRKED
ncbi:hypothetical protein BCR33DRAFT_729187 [Rhizoclosmatium globosum]|uniref:TLC domain-containing protein n=1 Tax=Rhizoclosmatium globosum TaxID=329046 RepID=A0A1Y2AHJ7_9FUNG|nr:hypothetical protein BCR33DRAFT_729187 [Rhizoclosmatium globosum]|eukprot:ORY21760.1 hypothetical protein BCR33DRAFT_729187 [Rhizoclosmatium globosum]